MEETCGTTIDDKNLDDPILNIYIYVHVYIM